MINQINNGGPAMHMPWNCQRSHEGISIRDYFAAAALQGLMGRVWGEAPAQELFEIWTKSSYAISDAMIKAREVKP